MSYQEKIIYLQIEVRDLASIIRINDIPVSLGRLGKERVVGLPLRAYLLNKTNVLSVEISPRREAIPEGAELLARVARFSDGTVLDLAYGETLALLQPDLPVDLTTPAHFTQAFSVDPLDGAPDSWHWSRAPNLASAVATAQIDAYVARLADMFAAANIEGLVEAQIPRLSDDVRAYPVASLNDAINMTRANLAALTRLPPAVRILDLSQLTYRSAAEGRLVELLDSQGEPFLKTLLPEGENRFGHPQDVTLPAMLGLADGRLAILR